MARGCDGRRRYDPVQRGRTGNREKRDRGGATEIDRLEDALSLFRAKLGIAAPEPREGAAFAQRRPAPRARLGARYRQLSGGLFDPTVQALWEAHVDWFCGGARCRPAAGRGDRQGAEAVDWRRILIEPDTDPYRGGSTPYAQRPWPGLCHRPCCGTAHWPRPETCLVDLGEQRAVGRRRAASRG